MPLCALRRRDTVAHDTASFFFEKPAGFDFQPGQFAELTLMSPPETDAEGDLRAFSIASAPYESDLMFTTRLRDTAFKRVLKTLPLGTLVQLEGAYGTLTLHEDLSRPAVFLAGGIGITPFLSMVRQAARERRPQKLILFYSNRRPEDAPFLEDLEKLGRENDNFKLVATMTQPAGLRPAWQGETGHITAEMLARHVGNLPRPVYYIAGPPALVKAMRETLKTAGVGGQSVRAEEFAGY